MEKLMKKYNNSRRNGGFSLVELIIVIAIMAALVAVLAPQYLKYIEKSRVSADQTALDEYYNAVQVALADETTVWGAGTITLSVNATTGVATPAFAAGVGVTVTNPTIIAVTKTNLGEKDVVLKSKVGKALGTNKLVITIDANGGAKWTTYPTAAEWAA